MRLARVMLSLVIILPVVVTLSACAPGEETGGGAGESPANPILAAWETPYDLAVSLLRRKRSARGLIQCLTSLGPRWWG